MNKPILEIISACECGNTFIEKIFDKKFENKSWYCSYDGKAMYRSLKFIKEHDNGK